MELLIIIASCYCTIFFCCCNSDVFISFFRLRCGNSAVISKFQDRRKLMNRPNILYIHSHDTGRYIQPYGYAVPTPSLQKLAEQGVLFRQAFTAGPTCSPSRAGLLTGTAPHTCGMLGLAHRGWRLNDYSWHILHTLRTVGYYSALCGIQHIAGAAAARPEEIGYDRLLENVNIHDNRDVADKASAFLREKHEKPFFLSVGFFDTHRDFPSQPGPQDDERYVRPPAPLPDTPRNRRDMACYVTSARRYDEGVGHILKTLDECGLAQNTLVICTTDHGIAFPHMKCNLSDHGIGVMLLMRGPHGFTGGKVIDSLVSQIDIFPTLCDVADAEKPGRLQGMSLLPLVEGSAEKVNDEIFSEVTFHACYEPKRCIRTERWKLILRMHPRSEPYLPNCDDSLSKDEWLDAGWSRRAENEPVQLYDLLYDPNEMCNLAGKGEAAGVEADLRARLLDWMRRTDDPLLSGGPDLPAHFTTNNIDGSSPRNTPLTRDEYASRYEKEKSELRSFS